MKSCDIHIRSIDPGELGDIGLECSIKIEEADITDKLCLMHALAVNLKLTKRDLVTYVGAEIDHIFDLDSTRITIPGGLKSES